MDPAASSSGSGGAVGGAAAGGSGGEEDITIPRAAMNKVSWKTVNHWSILSDVICECEPTGHRRVYESKYPTG